MYTSLSFLLSILCYLKIKEKNDKKISFPLWPQLPAALHIEQVSSLKQMLQNRPNANMALTPSSNFTYNTNDKLIASSTIIDRA